MADLCVDGMGVVGGEVVVVVGVKRRTRQPASKSQAPARDLCRWKGARLFGALLPPTTIIAHRCALVAFDGA